MNCEYLADQRCGCFLLYGCDYAVVISVFASIIMWLFYVLYFSNNLAEEDGMSGCFAIVFLFYVYLSHDVASGSDITPCNKINTPPVVYIFTTVLVT